MEIEWTGPKKCLTGYGVFDKGNIVTLPDDIANSLIEQGLATTTVKTNYEERGKSPPGINKIRKKED